MNNASKLNSTGRSRFSRGQQILLVILLLGAVYAFNTFTHNSSNPPPLASTTIVPVSTPNAGAGGDVVASNPSGALPTNANSLSRRPASTRDALPRRWWRPPAEYTQEPHRLCPWYPVAISSILSLSWSKNIEQKPRASWSSSDAAQVAQYEGIPVQIEGWLAGAKQRGPNRAIATRRMIQITTCGSSTLKTRPAPNPWWPRSRLACAPSIPAGPSLVYKSS